MSAPRGFLASSSTNFARKSALSKQSQGGEFNLQVFAEFNDAPQVGSSVFEFLLLGTIRSCSIRTPWPFGRASGQSCANKHRHWYPEHRRERR